MRIFINVNQEEAEKERERKKEEGGRCEGGRGRGKKWSSLRLETDNILNEISKPIDGK